MAMLKINSVDYDGWFEDTIWLFIIAMENPF